MIWLALVLAVAALLLGLYALLGLIVTERRHTREVDALTERVELLEIGLQHHLNVSARWSRD